MGVRIWHDNFLDASVVSNQTESSEQAAFPASNMFNFQRRSKVWRSNGFWEITASNNTIIFRETLAVNLTATIAVGEYTSSTTFFAAIKTALEDAGASTYTVTADATTSKVKITSNGSGGGGVFQIDWTTSTAASILGFATTEEDTGALTYTADALKIHTSEWVKWDFGISTLPKAFALIGSRNSPIKISPGATLKLQGNETDIWTDPTEDITLTYGDDVIYTLNTAGLWTEALRFARLYIVDSDNPNGYVQIGSLFLGDYFEPTRGGVQFPFSGAFIDSSVTSISEGGQSFSDVRQKTEVFSIDWYGINITDKELINDLWDNLGTSNSFFMQFDPDTAFSSSANKMIRYVKFQQAPQWNLVSPGNFSCKMTLREEL